MPRNQMQVPQEEADANWGAFRAMNVEGILVPPSLAPDGGLDHGRPVVSAKFLPKEQAPLLFSPKP